MSIDGRHEEEIRQFISWLRVPAQLKFELRTRLFCFKTCTINAWGRRPNKCFFFVASDSSLILHDRILIGPYKIELCKHFQLWRILITGAGIRKIFKVFPRNNWHLTVQKRLLLSFESIDWSLVKCQLWLSPHVLTLTAKLFNQRHWLQNRLFILFLSLSLSTSALTTFTITISVERNYVICFVR